jgi:hypothetical protein
MDLSKFTDADLDALEKGDIRALSDAGLDELERQQGGSGPSAIPRNDVKVPSPQDMLKTLTPSNSLRAAGAASANAPGMTEALVNSLPGIGDPSRLLPAVKNIVDDPKQIGRGIMRGLKVLDGDELQEKEKTPARMGQAAGTLLELEGMPIGGKAGEMAEGAVSNMAEGAARMAVGITKKIAKAIGVDDIPAVSKFLMEPIKVGEKTFEPIVTATKSEKDMLDIARNVRTAAGKQLEEVADEMDSAIKSLKDGYAVNPNSVVDGVESVVDIQGLGKSIKALEEGVVLKRLGKTVIKQYQEAMSDLNDVIAKSMKGDTADLFSALSKAKTSLGDLIYKHGAPLESKAALEDVYHVVSRMLADSAKKVGGDVAEKYEEANKVYHMISSVTEALEGKALSSASAGTGLKGFLNDPAALVAGLGAGTASGPLGFVTGPAAFLATKAAEAYGPQAVAQGLKAATPLAGGLAQRAVASVPVVGNAIAQALQRK